MNPGDADKKEARYSCTTFSRSKENVEMDDD